METAHGLHQAGVLNSRAMKRFTALCDLKVLPKKRKTTLRGRVC